MMRGRASRVLPQIGLNCGVLFLSILFSLIVLEIGLRAYLAFADQFTAEKVSEVILLKDSPRAYGYRPLLGGPLNTNSHGFRGPEFAIKKSEGITRILMLGDSVTAGNSVKWNETSSYLLQDILNSHFETRRFEVINLGVFGYNTFQELAVLREIGLSLEPDIIILNIVLNDSDPVKKLGAFGLNNEIGISKISDINIRTIIGSSLALTFLQSKIAAILRKFFPGMISTVYSPEIFINPRTLEEGWDLMKQHMNEILHESSTHGARLGVVIYPYRSQLALSDSERVPQRDLIKFWETKNVPVLDPISRYREVGGEMFGDEFLHLSPRGHFAMAQAIYEFIKESRLLPD